MFLSDLYKKAKDFINQDIIQPTENFANRTNNWAENAQKYFSNDQTAGGVVNNTIRGLPQATGQIVNQTFIHPADTFKSVTTGLAEGLQPLFNKVAQFEQFHPDLGITQQQQNDVNNLAPIKEDPLKNYLDSFIHRKPQNPVEAGLEGGFAQASSMVPYMAGGEIAGASKLAETSPRLANYLGFAGTSQLLSDKKPTDILGRAGQALNDTVMFGLTGGLSKNTNLSEIEQKINDFGNERPALGLTTKPKVKSITDEISKAKAGVKLPEKPPVKAENITEFKFIDKTMHPNKFIKTVKNSPATSSEVKEGVNSLYEPLTNERVIKEANLRVKANPDDALTRVKNVTDNTLETQADSLVLIPKLQKEGRFDDAIDVVEATAKRATSSGQKIQLLSVYDKLSPEGILHFAQKQIRKAREEHPNKTFNLTEEQGKKLVEMAKEKDKLTGVEKEKALKSLSEEVERLAPSTLAQKITTVWKAGLLTGIKGAVFGNSVGNSAMGILKKTSDVPSALIDKGISLITGKRSKIFTMKGLLSGANEGVKKGFTTFVKGSGAEDIGKKLDYKKVYFSKSKLGRFAQKYTDTVFNFYSSADKPFFASALKNELYDRAMVEAKNKGLKGQTAKDFIKQLVKNPKEDMLDEATKAAKILVFQNKNALGEALSKVKGVAKERLGSTGELMSEGIAPFTGVPSSIATAVHHYSPTGMVKGVYDAIIQSKNNKFTQDAQRKLSEALGKGLTGVAVMWLGAKLTDSGQMTLGYPTDKGERTLWKKEGRQPYSIKIFGKWRSLNYMGPVMSLLSVGGEIQKAKGTGVESIGTGVAGSGKAIISSSPLSGVQSVLDVISDPNRYGKNYIKNQSASIVPTIVKDIANANDPYIREHNNVRESIQNRIPFLKNKLRVKRDFFGEKVKRSSGPIATVIDPFKSRGDVSDATVKELRRLQDAGEGPTMSSLGKNQSVFGQKITLTPDELNNLEEVTGKKVKSLMAETIASPGYKSLGDAEKKRVLDRIVNDVRKEVKEDAVASGNSTSFSNFNTNDIDAKNKREIAKLNLLNSDKSSVKVVGGYLRKNTDGTGAVFVSDNKYKTQLLTQNLSRNKRNGNIGLWLKNAQKKYLLLKEELKNPNADDLDKEQIQNKIDTLSALYLKYKGYSGFKKPKKAKKAKKIKFNKVKKVNITFKKPTSDKLISTAVSTKLPSLAKINPRKIRAKKLNLRIRRPNKIRIKR